VRFWSHAAPQWHEHRLAWRSCLLLPLPLRVYTSAISRSVRFYKHPAQKLTVQLWRKCLHMNCATSAPLRWISCGAPKPYFPAPGPCGFLLVRTLNRPGCDLGDALHHCETNTYNTWGTNGRKGQLDTRLNLSNLFYKPPPRYSGKYNVYKSCGGTRHQSIGAIILLLCTDAHELWLTCSKPTPRHVIPWCILCRFSNEMRPTSPKVTHCTAWSCNVIHTWRRDPIIAMVK